MPYLIFASVLWALSFGLIKTYLGGLDSSFVSWVRLGLSLLVFLPFFRPKAISARPALYLTLIGAIQYGLMYLTYLYSFRYLQAYQVALFTIFTPLWVTLLSDALERRFHLSSLVAASASVAATGLIVYRQADWKSLLSGFLVVQISNICFAVGQVFYKKLMATCSGVRDRDVFAYLYAGAFALTSAVLLSSFRFSTLIVSKTQWAVLIYLGVVASGVGFFAWNLGARKATSGTLAVLNNAKVPLGVLVSLVLFESLPGLLSLFKLAFALAILLAATVMTERAARLQSSPPKR